MTTPPSFARDLFVYVGTYTKTTSKGVYVVRLDPETGRLRELALAGVAANPSFFALSSDRRHLYAVSEGSGASYDGKASGLVNAFAIDAQTGALSFINQAASGGRDPCHISVGPDGKNAFVANYGGGSVAVLPVRADGGLGEPSCVIQHEGRSVHPTRQRQPYAHSITLSPDGRFAYAADLGTDKVYACAVNAAAGTLAPEGEISLAPGSGPRHLALHPDDRHAYLVNELANTITTFARAPDTGRLTPLQTVTTLPPRFTGASKAAEIAVHPSGRFVYASNRGHDSISRFAVDPVTGTLSFIDDISTQGKNPRHFAIDPSGRWLVVANQDSDSLVVFAVDPATGRLTSSGQSVHLDMPVCVQFL